MAIRGLLARDAATAKPEDPSAAVARLLRMLMLAETTKADPSGLWRSVW